MPADQADQAKNSKSLFRDDNNSMLYDALSDAICLYSIGHSNLYFLFKSPKIISLHLKTQTTYFWRKKKEKGKRKATLINEHLIRWSIQGPFDINNNYPS